MAFTFETSGNNTFLVYMVQENDVLDTMTLGMITNNRIPGLASVLYTQMNLDKYLKYNVTARVTVSQFFSGVVNRKRLLGVFSSITAALAVAEDYMIDLGCLLLDTNYIYADVSTCKAEVVCLPIFNADGNTDAGMFFKNIMFTTQFDQTENCDYVARIINYLNGASMFSVSEFKVLLDELQGNAGVQPAAYETQQPIRTNSVQPTPVQAVPVQQQQKPAQQVVSQNVAPQNMAPKPAVQQVVKPPVTAQSRPGTAPQQAVNPTKPQNTTSVGFAVPGQLEVSTGFVVPGQNKPVPTPQAKTASVPNAPRQEKGMSMFYLLQHYNKENVALYKAQKEAKKNAGKATPKAPTPASNAGFAVPGQQAAPRPQPQQVATPQPQQVVRPQPQQVVASQPQQVVGPQPQQVVVPQPQQVVTSQPVQPQFVQQPMMSGNFGDTVIMGDDNFSDDTVVIGEMQTSAAMKPHLVRISNNERIPLEKPVFHIGKERSYVDYCISGNSTISRSHADIITKNGQCFIMDINSTNHTYVNGEMIPSNVEVPLTHGTKLLLSNEEFEFKLF